MMIRKATKSDIEQIMQIIADARISMKQLGIDQWQDGYPQKSIIVEDIEKERSYVASSDDGVDVYATYALIEDGEPTYNEMISGKWLTGYTTGEEYVAIHRFAVAKRRRGTGLSDVIMRYIYERYKNSGFTGIRVDTHAGNTHMRRLLQRQDFEYCGVIHLENGQPRVAYERVIKN